MKSIIAIFIPLLIMGLWTARQAYDSSYGDLVELPVRGYDSQDLFSSHYLKYQVDYGKYPICKKRTEDRKWRVCVCLEVVGPRRRAIASWSGHCGKRPQWGCRLWLRGYCFYDRFVANIERYYVPERYAKSLTVIPSGASIHARLNGKGNGVITDFRVKGQSLIEFAKRNQATNPPEQRAPAQESEPSEKTETQETAPGEANTNAKQE